MKILKLFIVLVSLQTGLTANAAISEKEEANFQAQYQLATNTSLPMSQRWKALLNAAEAADGAELQKVVEFTQNKDWFMRNAALVALDKMGSDTAYDQAKILIKDKALVVRSAAADILVRRNNSEVRKIFSEELTKPYNFASRKSLWIRPQMMKYLVQTPNADEKTFFISQLHDKDQAIASLSTEALEKITSIRFEGKTKSEVISKWKKLAQDKKW